MRLYTVDFETTTDPKDCRVWAWGLCEIAEGYSFTYGNTIEGFFEHVQKMDNCRMYVPNLKFDGEFFFNALFRMGFNHVKDRKDLKNKTFTTLISDMGQFYSCKIVFKKSAKKSKVSKFKK